EADADIRCRRVEGPQACLRRCKRNAVVVLHMDLRPAFDDRAPRAGFGGFEAAETQAGLDDVAAGNAVDARCLGAVDGREVGVGPQAPGSFEGDDGARGWMGKCPPSPSSPTPPASSDRSRNSASSESPGSGPETVTSGIAGTS